MKEYTVENASGKQVTFQWENDQTPPTDSDFEEVFKAAETFKPPEPEFPPSPYQGGSAGGFGSFEKPVLKPEPVFPAYQDPFKQPEAVKAAAPMVQTPPALKAPLPTPAPMPAEATGTPTFKPAPEVPPTQPLPEFAPARALGATVKPTGVPEQTLPNLPPVKEVKPWTTDDINTMIPVTAKALGKGFADVGKFAIDLAQQGSQDNAITFDAINWSKGENPRDWAAKMAEGSRLYAQSLEKAGKRVEDAWAYSPQEQDALERGGVPAAMLVGIAQLGSFIPLMVTTGGEAQAAKLIGVFAKKYGEEGLVKAAPILFKQAPTFTQRLIGNTLAMGEIGAVQAEATTEGTPEQKWSAALKSGLSMAAMGAAGAAGGKFVSKVTQKSSEVTQRLAQGGVQAGVFGGFTAAEGGRPSDIISAAAMGFGFGVKEKPYGSVKQLHDQAQETYGKVLEPKITENLDTYANRAGKDVLYNTAKTNFEEKLGTLVDWNVLKPEPKETGADYTLRLNAALDKAATTPPVQKQLPPKPPEVPNAQKMRPEAPQGIQVQIQVQAGMGAASGTETQIRGPEKSDVAPIIPAKTVQYAGKTVEVNEQDQFYPDDLDVQRKRADKLIKQAGLTPAMNGSIDPGYVNLKGQIIRVPQIAFNLPNGSTKYLPLNAKQEDFKAIISSPQQGSTSEPDKPAPDVAPAVPKAVVTSVPAAIPGAGSSAASQPPAVQQPAAPAKSTEGSGGVEPLSKDEQDRIQKRINSISNSTGPRDTELGKPFTDSHSDLFEETHPQNKRWTEAVDGYKAYHEIKSGPQYDKIRNQFTPKEFNTQLAILRGEKQGQLDDKMYLMLNTIAEQRNESQGTDLKHDDIRTEIENAPMSVNQKTGFHDLTKNALSKHATELRREDVQATDQDKAIDDYIKTGKMVDQSVQATHEGVVKVISRVPAKFLARAAGIELGVTKAAIQQIKTGKKGGKAAAAIRQVIAPYLGYGETVERVVEGIVGKLKRVAKSQPTVAEEPMFSRKETSQLDVFGGEKTISQLEKEDASRTTKAEIARRQETPKGGAADLGGLPMFENQDFEGSQQTLQFSRKQPMDRSNAEAIAEETGLKYNGLRGSDKERNLVHAFTDKRTGTQFKAISKSDVHRALADIIEGIAPEKTILNKSGLKFSRKEEPAANEIDQRAADRDAMSKMLEENQIPEDSEEMLKLIEIDNNYMDFFETNGYTYDEEKQQYVKNTPESTAEYWSSFGRDTQTSAREVSSYTPFSASKSLERAGEEKRSEVRFSSKESGGQNVQDVQSKKELRAAGPGGGVEGRPQLSHQLQAPLRLEKARNQEPVTALKEQLSKDDSRYLGHPVAYTDENLFIIEPNEEQRQHLALAKKISGKKAYFIELNGVYSEFDGVYYDNGIFIDRRNTQPLIRVVFHESMHGFERQSPVDVNSFYDVFEENLTDKGREEVQDYTDKWKVSFRYALKEKAGDYAGDVMGKSKFWEDLANKFPDTFRKFVAELLKQFKKLMDLIPHNSKWEKILKDHQKVYESLLDTYAAVRGKDIPKASEGMAQFMMKVFHGSPSISENERATFSRKGPQPEDKTLIAIHNIGANEILKAEQYGGLAVPSIGITKKNLAFEGFGDITLIANKDMIDPSKGYNPAYSSDVYSATVPRPVHKVNKKAGNKFMEEVNGVGWKDYGMSYGGEIQRKIDNGDMQGFKNEAQYDVLLKAKFLKENGIIIKKPMRSANYADGQFVKLLRTEPVQKWFDENPEFSSDIFNDKEKGKSLGDAIKAGVNIEFKGEPELIEQGIENLMGEDGIPYFGPADRLHRAWYNDKQNKQELDRSQLGKNLTKEVKKLGEDKYKQWIDKKAEEIFFSPYIDKPGKPSYTLENIVEAMTTGQIHGVEKNLTFGIQKAKSFGATLFKNIDEMKAAQNKLTDYETYEAEKKKTETKFYDAAEKLSKYYEYSTASFQRFDDTSKSLADYYRGKKTLENMMRALRKNGFKGVPDFIAEDMQAVAKELIENPVVYFESKPQRAVQLSEFKGAVVPKGTAQNVLDVLTAKSIPITEYNPKKEGDRAKKVQKFSEEQGLVFSRKQPDEPELDYSLAGYESKEQFNKAFEEKSLKEHNETKKEFLQRSHCSDLLKGKNNFSIRSRK